MIYSAHASKTNFYDDEQAIQKITAASWLSPGVISTLGAVLGATINSSLESSSRIYQIIGCFIGVGSIVIGTELAATKLYNEEEKIGLVLKTAKEIKQESEIDGKKVLNYLKKIDFQIKSFLSTLNFEQTEAFLSVIGEYELLEEDPVQVCQNLRRATLLSQKQYELLNIFSSTFKETKQIKGLEIFCKLANVKEKNLLDELEKTLALTELQKDLFCQLTSSLDTKMIYLAIQSGLQLKLSSKIQSHFEKLKIAQDTFLFAPSLAALLSILNPSRLIGRIQPLSATWTLLQLGTFVLGATAVGYIFYQYFYLNQHKQIQIQAEQTQETLRAF